MEKLRDIKDIVEVSDYSIYYLFGYITLAILIFCVIIYLLSRQKKRKKLTKKEMALQELKNIDYENSKDIAYKFTLNIPYFIDEKNKKEIEELLESLKMYKYKKDIPTMDKELKQRVKKMIGVVK